MEMELIGVIDDEIREDVAGADSNEVSAKVAFAIGIAALFWVETKHFISGNPISHID